MLVKNITEGRLHVELKDGTSISLNVGETIESEKVFALERLMEIHFLAEEKKEEPKKEEKKEEPKKEELDKEEKKEEPKKEEEKQPEEQPVKVKVSSAVKPPKASK